MFFFLESEWSVLCVAAQVCFVQCRASAQVAELVRAYEEEQENEEAELARAYEEDEPPLCPE